LKRLLISNFPFAIQISLAITFLLTAIVNKEAKILSAIKFVMKPQTLEYLGSGLLDALALRQLH